MKTVYMRQLARQRWQLESENGHVLQENILIYSETDAETYALRYISSFPAWTCVIKPLEEKTDGRSQN